MTQSSPPGTLIALDSVSYGLPDGSILFSDLHEQFDQRPTGLVGRNGAGKTVLARILAGQLALATMLRSYGGALLVVSHDDALLDHLALTDRLEASAHDWRRDPW